MHAETFNRNDRWSSPEARLARTAAAASRPTVLAIPDVIKAWPAAVYAEPVVEGRVFLRKTVFVCAPDLVQRLLVDQADCLERDDLALRALTPALGKGILTSDGEAWRRQRRVAVPVFRHDRIASFVPNMMRATNDLRARWLARDAAAPLDVMREMMDVTFDIIIRTTMSDSSEADFATFSRDLTDYIEQTPWNMALTLLGAPAWMPYPGRFRGMRASKRLRQAIAAAIARRRAAGRSGEDLLGLMIDARDMQTGTAMSDAGIVDNLLTFVAAGHETTALSLAWTLRLLAEHPAVQSRVVAEIEAAGDEGPFDLAKLGYTKQVLMEAMRLYPPAPLIARRTHAPVNVGDRTVEAGRSIQVPVYALHRHRAIWPNADVFDPDRFSAEAQSARPRYSYLPFGGGPRVCIGASFAMTEAMVLLGSLLKSFGFATVSADRPAARFQITLRPVGGMPLYVTPRSRAARDPGPELPSSHPLSPGPVKICPEPVAA